MQITHVVPALSLSGVPRFVADLAAMQARAGCRVDVVSLLRGSDQRRRESVVLREQMADAKVRLTEFNAPNLRTGMPLLALCFAARFLRDRGVLHAHDHSSEFLSAMLRRLRPLARARTIHNRPPPVNKVYARFIERAPADELVVSVSRDIQSEHRDLRAALGTLPPMLERVIVNGITPPLRLHAPRSAATVRSDGLRAVFFGRAVPQKGLDTLAAAIELLDDVPLRLDVFSDAEPGNPLVRTLATRPDRVRLSPLVANARDRMADYDVLVMPSRFEGLGLVAVEAFAAGTPVVATDVSGLREALPSNWPLRCPSEDPAALATMLRQLHQGRWNLEELSLTAKRHAAMFDMEHCVARYGHAYDELLRMMTR